MFGKTNSLVKQSSSSGGDGADIVYAVNNTGGEIAVGDKIWLNKHIYGNNDGVFGSWGDSAIQYPVPYNIDNKWYVNVVTTLYRLDYDAVKPEWKFVRVGAANHNDANSVFFKEDMVWSVFNNVSYILKGNGYQQKIEGIVFAPGKAYSQTSSKLTTYNQETGEIDKDNGFALSYYRMETSFLLDGNILFYNMDGYTYSFYDVTDYAAPVLLNTGTITSSLNSVYSTGTSVGDYIVMRSGGARETVETTFYMYKILDGYRLEPADDLPDSLKAMIGTKARVSYNNKTKILIVGSFTKIRFYKFENGMFNEFFIDFLSLPQNDGRFAYLARLSDDMSSITITVYHSYRFYVYVYRLNAQDNRWYAEAWNDAHPLSLMGFVNSEANEEGMYEIRTLLPEVCRYDVTITPTPDTIYFNGDVR
ncbi:MAG: hypothetical protein NC218_10505 [Acetobacter sp.]|nr:hypothetical protein [Acetobacter sp.]